MAGRGGCTLLPGGLGHLRAGITGEIELNGRAYSHFGIELHVAARLTNEAEDLA